MQTIVFILDFDKSVFIMGNYDFSIIFNIDKLNIKNGKLKIYFNNKDCNIKIIGRGVANKRNNYKYGYLELKIIMTPLEKQEITNIRKRIPGVWKIVFYHTPYFDHINNGFLNLREKIFEYRK